jgi:hypothetical protein
VSAKGAGVPTFPTSRHEIAASVYHRALWSGRKSTQLFVRISALPPRRLSDLNLWALGYELLWDERDPHPPSSVNGKQTTELPKRQLLVVDMDRDFPIWAAVVDDAPEHVAARAPLVAAFVEVDLRLAWWLLDYRLVPFLQQRPLRIEDAVVHFDDVRVGHRGDAWSNGNVRTGKFWVGMVNGRVVAVARNSDLIEQNVCRSFWAHVPVPLGGLAYSRKAPRLDMALERSR